LSTQPDCSPDLSYGLGQLPSNSLRAQLPEDSGGEGEGAASSRRLTRLPHACGRSALETRPQIQPVTGRHPGTLRRDFVASHVLLLRASGRRQWTPSENAPPLQDRGARDEPSPTADRLLACLLQHPVLLQTEGARLTAVRGHHYLAVRRSSFYKPYGCSQWPNESRISCARRWRGKCRREAPPLQLT